MIAYVAGNGPSVNGWEPAQPLYVTNKYPPWMRPAVYVVVSKHATAMWGDAIKKRMQLVLDSGGRVLVSDALRHRYTGGETISTHRGLWYRADSYGIGGGSLFPLMQRAVLDGATHIILAGVDGYRGETCADGNHYDKDYYSGSLNKPGSARVNSLMAKGHVFAAAICSELGISVQVVGESIFKDCYT